eukprot:TRINITY_DN18215_c0_g1_i1.p1 TRINITY_DN18215_c0_g1~~TRINITY_DN18215_c0_g1_i1.p1  ORF type:complete len:534 (+),score=146.22 TRINITY_DN18215_c0_g1_i1:188-1789(+)
MDLATALIWALRIILPIVLFCIYFKLQAPKDEVYPGPTGNSHPRSRLLAQRNLVQDNPKPDEIANMTVVDASQAPNLFSAQPNRSRGGRGGAREPRESREDRREQRGGAREGRRDRNERGERSSERPRRSEGQPPREESPQGREAQPPVVSVAEPTDTAPPALSAAEEKMHLESLLNYVAFNRREQQRTFLPDKSAPPPPPPPKPPKKPTDSAEGSSRLAPSPATAVGDQSSAVTGTEATKANAEAQMVLSGAIKFRRVDVAKKLYDQLSDQQVEISGKTFVLMVESCVLAEDLKSASDFLIKMEASGHSPDSELLDKVMDLYSQQKVKEAKAEEQKADAIVAPAAPVLLAEEMTRNVGSSAVDYGPVDYSGGEQDVAMATETLPEAPRTKLSSEATLFVPNFSFGQTPGLQPPPPPPPPPAADTAGSTDAAAAPGQEGASPEPVARTALKAASKAFVPQSVLLGGGGVEHSWDTALGNGEETHDQGKSKGKGKARNKGGKDSSGNTHKEKKQKEAGDGGSAKWKKKVPEDGS